MLKLATLTLAAAMGLAAQQPLTPTAVSLDEIAQRICSEGKSLAGARVASQAEAKGATSPYIWTKIEPVREENEPGTQGFLANAESDKLGFQVRATCPQNRDERRLAAIVTRSDVSGERILYAGTPDEPLATLPNPVLGDERFAVFAVSVCAHPSRSRTLSEALGRCSQHMQQFTVQRRSERSSAEGSWLDQDLTIAYFHFPEPQPEKAGSISYPLLSQYLRDDEAAIVRRLKGPFWHNLEPSDLWRIPVTFESDFEKRLNNDESARLISEYARIVRDGVKMELCSLEWRSGEFTQRLYFAPLEKGDFRDGCICYVDTHKKSSEQGAIVHRREQELRISSSCPGLVRK